MINPLQIYGEIINALWPRDTSQQRTLPEDTTLNSRECRAPGPFDCIGCNWYGRCELPTSPVAGAKGRDAADRPTRISGLSPLGGTTSAEAQYDACGYCGRMRREHDFRALLEVHGVNTTACSAFVEPKTSAVPPTAEDDPAAGEPPAPTAGSTKPWPQLSDLPGYSPTVPAGVSADPPSVPSAGLPHCEHCQQPIEPVSRIDAWFHTGSQRLPCAGIPGYPRTFAAPQM